MCCCFHLHLSLFLIIFLPPENVNFSLIAKIFMWLWMFLKLVFIFKQSAFTFFGFSWIPLRKRGRSLNVATILFYCSYDMPSPVIFFSLHLVPFPWATLSNIFATLPFLELVKSVTQRGVGGVGGECSQCGREALHPSYGVLWLQISLGPLECIYFPTVSATLSQLFAIIFLGLDSPLFLLTYILWGVFWNSLPPSHSWCQLWESVFITILVNYCF